ncbi:hypothetical protein [Francisella marina]|uniref:DUF4393 domain-containing protein n=1 Tax=Francisella marina TaxID=2249302 RepID=A0ABX5ZHA3_9GAMM|nr:hypothetical protein [Francisella marina]QEO57845.1 hypothetical protein F0R74_08280 [Francisella marina]QEO59929.1 hypothetical protein F0R75_09035 [Francisella marina]
MDNKEVTKHQIKFTDEIDNLKSNKLDASVSIFKMLSSFCPGLSNVSEGIGFLIKNQRLDRVCNFIEKMALRIDELSLSYEFMNKIINDEKYEYIFSELISEASKPANYNKKKYIQNIIIKGLDDNFKDQIYDYMFDQILSDLNEREILYLATFLHYPHSITTYATKEEVFQDFDSEHDFWYIEDLQKIYTNNLINKGLLHVEKPNISSYFEGHVQLDHNNPEISKFGELFIKYIWDDSIAKDI